MATDRGKENADKIKKVRESIGRKLPTGVPVPLAIRSASSDLVTTCDERFKAIEAELKKANLDAYTKEALLAERETINQLLDEVYQANAGVERTYEQIWKDNAAIINYVTRDLPERIMLAIAELYLVLVAAILLAVLLAPPLGIFLAAAVIVGYCAYKIGTGLAGLYSAWCQVNEQKASRQLVQGEKIKEINVNVAKAMLDDAAKELASAKEAVGPATKELEEANAAVKREQAIVDGFKEKLGDLEEQVSDLESDVALIQAHREILVSAKKEADVTITRLTEPPHALSAEEKKELSQAKKLSVDFDLEIKLGSKTEARIVAQISEIGSRVNQKKNQIKDAEGPTGALGGAIALQSKKEQAVGAATKRVETADAAHKVAEKRVGRLSVSAMSPLARSYSSPTIDPKTGRKPSTDNKGPTTTVASNPSHK